VPYGVVVVHRTDFGAKVDVAGPAIVLYCFVTLRMSSEQFFLQQQAKVSGCLVVAICCHSVMRASPRSQPAVISVHSCSESAVPGHTSTYSYVLTNLSGRIYARYRGTYVRTNKYRGTDVRTNKY